MDCKRSFSLLAIINSFFLVPKITKTNLLFDTASEWIDY